MAKPSSDSSRSGSAKQPTSHYEEQLIFYGSYHRNPWNKLIHFIFVPLILGTALIFLLKLVPLSLPIPALAASPYPILAECLQINIAWAVVLAYALYYVLGMDIIAGLSWTVFVGLPMAALPTYLVHRNDPSLMQWAVGVHILSWYMQIHPGHVILEGRKPALLDSLVQAFATAPLFVWLELLFCMGYDRGLQRRVDEGVERAVKKFHAKQK